jgi:hypothetical protein
MAFLRCLTMTMPVSVASLFRHQFGLTAEDRLSAKYLAELWSAVHTEDCISGEGGIPIRYRWHLLADPTFLPGSLPGECWCSSQTLGGVTCLDNMCHLPEACRQSKYSPCRLDYRSVEAQPTECLLHTECNWLDCEKVVDQLSNRSCEDVCMTDTHDSVCRCVCVCVLEEEWE